MLERVLQRLREMSPLDTEQECVLVVVERDAACPYWMDHWGPQPDNGWSMLEQEAGERLASFRERFSAALERCSFQPSAYETIVLVAGGRCDASTRTTRWETATALLTHLVRLGRGHLVLTRGYGDGAELPLELLSLADELSEAWRGAGPLISVRLEGYASEFEPRRSGGALDSAPFTSDASARLEESAA